MSKLSIKQCCELIAEHGMGVPPDLGVALIWEESGGQTDIVSSAGAVGLMQIMQRFHEGVDLTDPVTNVKVGCQVLISDFFYLNHFRAGISPHSPASLYPWDNQPYLFRALAGYNMGPGNVVWYDNHPDKQWPAGVQNYCDIIWRMSLQKHCS